MIAFKEYFSETIMLRFGVILLCNYLEIGHFNEHE